MLLTRRSLLALGAALSTAGFVGSATGRSDAGGAMPRLGAGEGFGAASVSEKAQALSQSAYEPPLNTIAETLTNLNYDQYRQIRYRADSALWKSDDLNFEAQFFHPGSVYDYPVAINLVSGGTARPILFSPELFDYGPSIETTITAEDALGFAGFRLHAHINREDYRDEFAVFQGAAPSFSSRSPRIPRLTTILSPSGVPRRRCGRERRMPSHIVCTGVTRCQ